MQAASCFTSAELRFLAEDVPTSVIPNFNGKKGGDVTLLQGKIAAFNPTEALLVPLWMGLHLKRQGRCTFSVSTRDRKGHSLEWLKESRLSSTVQQEKNRDPPQRLEFHTIETADLMCRHAREDMLNWHSTSDLLSELNAYRKQKLRQYVYRRNPAKLAKAYYFSDYGANELNSIRDFIAQSSRIYRCILAGKE